MNPLYQGRPNPVPGLNLNDVLDFVNKTNPQDAKSQVEQLLSSGKISQAQLKQAMDKATQIANILGIK